MAKIYANRDNKDWCHRMQEYAPVTVFDRPEEVPDEPGVVVSLNLHHKVSRRAADKQLAKDFADTTFSVVIPDAYECELYDDKIAQAQAFKEWMPYTTYINDPEVAKYASLSCLSYPLVSKAAGGASSSNVRLIRNAQEAEAELDLAFGDGIPLVSGQRQKDYVLWQEFIPGNAFDYRVCIIANRYAFIVKRFTGSAGPFASGSDGGIETYDTFEGEQLRVVTWVMAISQKMQLSRAAFDIIQDETGKLFLTEASCCWGLRVSQSRWMYLNDGKEWEPTEYNGDEKDPVVLCRAITEGLFR